MKFKVAFMNKFFLFLVFTVLPIFAFAEPSVRYRSISSPDGKIHVDFFCSQWGVPMYKVFVDSIPFINDSELGLSFAGSVRTGHNIDKVNYRWEIKDIWTQPWGENKKNISLFNEMTVTLKQDYKYTMAICFRVFNDGVAIRYNYDLTNAEKVLINDDCTEFNFSSKGTAWWIPADADTYELEYRHTALDEIGIANTPITFRLDNGFYASIHEAALYSFSEMNIKYFPEEGFLSASLANTQKDNTYLKVMANSNFFSPWRTIQIGRKAVDLINSSLILNLNEPSKIEDVSWIKPMKYIGIWWGMHLGINGWTIDDRHGATTKNAKRYIDFAAKHNIDAVLIEGWNTGWETWGKEQKFDYTAPYADFDIAAVSKYAKKRGVAIIGHHETGGNMPFYEQKMDSAMMWYKNYGVNCIKTGYAGAIPRGFTHHGQYAVEHYQSVLECAAKHKIMLDVHEPIKDTGIRRTWPNMMTREGARGMEWNAWSSGNTPEHTVTLPYTRLLAGPMDYNPGVFDILFENTRNLPERKMWNDNDKGDSRVNTTIAKQIANWVILYSPLQMAADIIENYEGNSAFEFFEDFNPDCDWSAALDGEIGEYIVVARRAGEMYFVGASTDTLSRKINLPLGFLRRGQTYVAEIYADGDNADWKSNPTEYKISSREVTASDTLNMQLAQGGGQAIVFKPKK